MSDGIALGIDPGAHPGFALVVRSGDILTPIVVQRGPVPPADLPLGTIVFVERPVLRPEPPGRAGRRRIDPRSIVTLAFRAGLAAGRYSATHSVVEVEPDTWKGRVAKPVMLNRIRAAHPGFANRSDDEIDSIGIACHGLGWDWIRLAWR